MISDTHKFIFVHINKTGGTSIEKVFDPQADQRDVRYKHATAAFYKQAFPDPFRDYFKFAFVRNPWDWLVSRYHWSRDHQRLFDYSFDELLWRLKNRTRLSAAAPWLEEDALQPQLDRLTIGGAIAMDFVGRFENLQRDFDRICSNLRIEARTLQPVFKTNHALYVEYYDDEARKIVEELYAADIAAFGYRFGDLPRSMRSMAATDENDAIRTFWHGSDSLRPPWAAGAWTQRVANASPFEFVPMRAAGADTQRLNRPWQRNAASVEPSGIRVERLEGNPIIRAAMLHGNDGNNINGPSLIRAPVWIKNPLGRYYLYFAHHEGKYIRLAYADDLAGPWTVYRPGTLPLESTACGAISNPVVARNKHVASPDVHVDDKAREIRMYFHGPVHASGPPENESSYQQLSLVATSKNGLQFEARAERLGNPYFRVFKWNDAWYALGMPGTFYRSADGLQGFVEGPTLFTSAMRHSAVRVNGTTLQVFHTIVGENPERILLSTIELTRPWMEWKASKPRVVLEPQMDWEGAALPARPSVRGIARGPVRELRDPAIFVEAGRTYLLYSVAGESGIAIGELHLP